MIFFLKPSLRLRMRLSLTDRFSNQVTVKIGSLSILLLGISLSGCDSKSVTVPADSSNAQSELDEPVSEIDITEEQPVATDEEQAM
ncbi:MAG: hypothetical protein ACR2OA_10935, partial [Rubripirellula sp.]